LRIDEAVAGSAGIFCSSTIEASARVGSNRECTLVLDEVVVLKGVILRAIYRGASPESRWAGHICCCGFRPGCGLVAAIRVTDTTKLCKATSLWLRIHLRVDSRDWQCIQKSFATISQGIRQVVELDGLVLRARSSRLSANFSECCRSGESVAMAALMPVPVMFCW